MSVRVMAKVWEIALPDSQKLVMLALADCANDEGHAWPSIATLAKKCTRGVRTIQGVMIELERAGHISREQVPGKGCKYVVHPRSDCTPAATAPPQRTALTPAAAAPKPSRTIIPATGSSNLTQGARARTREPGPVETDPEGGQGEESLRPEHVVEAWNDMAQAIGLPAVRKLTPDRKTKLRARIREHGIDDFTEAIAAIERSPFLRGEQGREGWRGASFDWLLSPSKFVKLIEGQYDQPAHR